MTIDRAGLAPGLLVAMPQLDDPNFRRTIVLLLRSDPTGAFGLVVNRVCEHTVDELCRGQEIEYNGPLDRHVHLGGPVEVNSHLVVLHGDEPLHPQGDEGEILIVPGVRLVTELESLVELARRENSRMRCFVGYAGWGPGQLEDELAVGAWVPLPADPALVFGEDDDPEATWARALKDQGIDPLTLVPGGPLN